MCCTHRTLRILSDELALTTHRRYDSAGVCIDGVAKQLVIAKATGKVDVLAELANARVNNDTVCPGDEVFPSLQSLTVKTAVSWVRCMLEAHLRLHRILTLKLPHSMSAAAADVHCWALRTGAGHTGSDWAHAVGDARPPRSDQLPPAHLGRRQRVGGRPQRHHHQLPGPQGLLGEFSVQRDASAYSKHLCRLQLAAICV